MSYSRVIDALQEHELSWGDIDRIELNEKTYNEFQERSSKPQSNYSTTDAPAVRETRGVEQIVYINNAGVLETIEL